jgi:mitogen-activated protein kinase 7
LTTGTFRLDVDQLNQIMGILGTPDDTLLRRIGSEKALSYIRSLPRMSKVPFSKLYPKATPAALDLLEKMLKWDPLERITIEKALEHPYLASYHDKEDEPACPTHFDFGFESVKTLDDIRSGCFAIESMRKVRADSCFCLQK